MALENIEENQEKVNAAALSVLEDGAKNKITKEVVDEQEVVDDPQIIKTKDGKFSIDIMGALSNVGSSATSALSSIGESASQFVQGVGSNLSAIAEAVPNKIEEIASDPEKKKNFMRGLEIINASSGIKPIGQATSTVGAISKGLLKAEKGFIATDLAKAKNENERLKALNTKRGVLNPQEAALLKNYTTYTDKFALENKERVATLDIYRLAEKSALEGKQLPTGYLEKTFQGTEQLISEIKGGSELLDKLLKRGGDTSSMTTDERVTFKNMLGAAVKQKIVTQVKELYPVSNKDIEILLQTVGDVGTDPEALSRLVSAQMATRELAIIQRKYATKLFNANDLDFKENSYFEAEKELGKLYRSKVKPETLKKMYGKTEGISDAGIVAAYYYQGIQSQFKDGKTPFDIFKETEAEKQERIDKIKEKYQKINKKEPIPAN